MVMRIGRKVNSNPAHPLHCTEADFEVDLRRQANARMHAWVDPLDCGWAGILALNPIWLYNTQNLSCPRPSRDTNTLIMKFKT